MTQPIYPAEDVVVGVAKEAAYGGATAPTFYLPVTTVAPADVQATLPDDSWRSVPATSVGHTPGALSSGVKLGGNVHPDGIGFPLAGILGDVVVTGSSAPYTTAIALLNTGLQQPKSYTITTVDDVGALAWPGQIWSSLTFTLDVAGAFTWAGQTIGLTAVGASRPSPAFTGVGLLPGWLCTTTIGGTVSSAVTAATINFVRTPEAKRNVNFSQAPYLTRAGMVAITGQVTVILQSDAIRAAYVAGTTTTLDFNFQRGSGSGAQQVKLHCSLVTLTDAPRMYPAGQWVEMTFKWAADANTTDIGASGGLSPMKATLMNAMPSGSYA